MLRYFTAAVLIFCALLLGFFTIQVGQAQYLTESAEPVAVESEVIEVTSRAGGRGGSVPVVRFEDAQGKIHHVDGRHPEVGEQITVYRMGDGFHRWEPGIPFIERVAPWGMGLLALGLATMAVFYIRGSQRA